MLIKEKLRAVIDKYRWHPDFLGIEIEDPNQPGAVDDTVLHIASMKGELEDMRILIASGANVNATGDLGNTPLHQAALVGQAQAVKVLLENGADVGVRNEFGETALQVAEQGNHKEVADILRSAHS